MSDEVLDLNRGILSLVQILNGSLPYLRPDQILVVAGQARLSSRATIRGFPQSPDCPLIQRRGSRIYYEITLRPGYFRSASRDERKMIIAHELMHIPQSFDGTLAEETRHSEISNGALNKRADKMLESVDSNALEKVGYFFESNRVCHLDTWLNRPPQFLRTGVRRSYDETALFLGTYEQL